MQTCCICGTGYKSPKEDILIYGCPKCHKGDWLKNIRSMPEIRIECPSPYAKKKPKVTID